MAFPASSSFRGHPGLFLFNRPPRPIPAQKAALAHRCSHGHPGPFLSMLAPFLSLYTIRPSPSGIMEDVTGSPVHVRTPWWPAVEVAVRQQVGGKQRN